MHLFAALSGSYVMGSNKDLIHSFITGGRLDLRAAPRSAGFTGIEAQMQISHANDFGFFFSAKAHKNSW